MVKWILAFVAIVALIGAVIGLTVKLDRRTTHERLGSEAYSIGIIDNVGDIDKTEKTSIYTKNAIPVNGLSIELEEKAKVTYSLFFYDSKDNFVSSKNYTATDFQSTDVPETAKTVRIVITPINDNEISLTEVAGYADQLIVMVDVR